MHKYNAHGSTDITGFGLLGHAQALARNQKNEVSFVIHNLPVIAKMAAVAKVNFGIHFNFKFVFLQIPSYNLSIPFCTFERDF